MEASVLQLRDIAKAFGSVRALNGVSFELFPGEVHALLGENGAGKSTLIKLITGAYQPDSGSITIAGRSIPHLTPSRAHQLGIACIYQQPALFADLTVAENIGIRLEPVRPFQRIHWDRRRAEARRLLERIGACIAPDAEIRSLSMPEQQLVEIACALGRGARIVIMDEPTASLTHREQERLFSVIRELRRDGVGVIYISHRLEEIFALADRVTVLRDGESVGTRVLRPHASPIPPGQPSASAALSESELIQLMVGREMSHIYPERKSQAGTAVLSVRGVGCAVAGLSGVGLDVRAGEVVGLSGLVGAGRTELARVLFGLTPADQGEILLEGRAVRPQSPSEAIDLGIGYVPEDRRRHGVILEMPISNNTTLAVLRRLFSGGWLRPQVERSLTLEYLRALAIKAPGPESPAGSLSGGNQQKVALARWLATRPRLLILDEPTQGVDVGAKSEIHRLIRNLADRGMAVLMISSDLQEILGMSDRILVMRSGRIAAELPGGTPADVVMAAALGQEGSA